MVCISSRFVPVFTASLALSTLAACGSIAPGAATSQRAIAASTGLPPAAMHGPYDFGWQLAGQRSLAPLQVFSSPQGVWMQFSREGTTPAIFGLDAGGAETLLPQTWISPYIFVPGTWAGLRFRAGAKRASARRVASGYPDQIQANHTGGSYAPEPGGDGVHTDAPRQGKYAVTRADINLRRALARWADAAGWTFSPEHWAVDGDIPISASAVLGNDFRRSVRALLASSELTDLPVQPCFYGNRVLRVIGISQQCDPRRDNGMLARPESAQI